MSLVLALLLLADLETARAHVAAKRYDAAVKEFKDVNSKQGGRCGECLVGLAEAFILMGEMGDAEKAAAKTEGLDLAPAQRARAQNALGIAVFRRAKDDKALRRCEAAFRAAVSADPTLLNARYNLGQVLMRQGQDEAGREELRRFIAEAPAGAASAQARRLIDNPRRARERFAPSFTAKTLDGEPIALDDFAGKVLVVDFWATWCAPCVASIPEIKELRRRYAAEKLAILSISADESAETARQFVAKNGMTWLQCHDAEGALSKAFGVHSFPTYLVVDGEGAVRLEIRGLDETQSLGARLRQTLEKMPELTASN
jgi:thioredoxin-like negative regulator of GroEL